jgi:hypothetical protein
MSVPTAPEPQFVAPSDAPKQSNGLGLAALIVAVVAFVFAVVPILSFLAWLPAVVAIGLAIAGLIVKNRKRTTSWIAIGVAVVAWIIAIVISVASVFGVAGAMSSAVGDAIESAAPGSTIVEDADDAAAEDADAAATGTLVYEVTTDAATIGSVTYMTATASGSGSEQVADAAAPFRVEVPIEGGAFDMTIASLVAQASADATTVSCKVTMNGEVVSEQTSTGQYAVVSCTGSDY